MRVIDGALQEWEAENVKPGPSKQLNRDTIYFHPDNATGIRRRIQKRAIAGDDQAQAIVAKLATGELSPNAAAVAVGMREQYIRISLSPFKAAKGLVVRQGQEWCLQLLEELSKLVL